MLNFHFVMHAVVITVITTVVLEKNRNYQIKSD